MLGIMGVIFLIEDGSDVYSDRNMVYHANCHFDHLDGIDIFKEEFH